MIKVPAGLVSDENPLPGMQTASRLLTASSHGGEREMSGMRSSSYKDISPVGLGSHPYALISP